MRPRTARWLAIALGVTLLGGTGSSLAQSRDVTEPPPVARAEDGTEMVRVPAGEFWMGSTEQEVARAIEECKRPGFTEATCRPWMERELPRHRVTLDAFSIDRHPVTNALYERFMRATGRPAPLYWTSARFNAPAQPVVGVSWDDASAYCAWAGRRLPTEAEWEKAARGTDGRTYPWGEQWDPGRANSDESKLGKPTPVGSYPAGASPYGALDMAGNVWQWVADWYDGGYYRRSPERNPKGPEAGTFRVLRGGSWFSAPLNLRSALRLNRSPGLRFDFIGFRCARELS